MYSSRSVQVGGYAGSRGSVRKEEQGATEGIKDKNTQRKCKFYNRLTILSYTVPHDNRIYCTVQCTEYTVL